MIGLLLMSTTIELQLVPRLGSPFKAIMTRGVTRTGTIRLFVPRGFIFRSLRSNHGGRQKAARGLTASPVRARFCSSLIFGRNREGAMAKLKKRAASATRNSSPLAATIFSGSSPAPGDVIPIPATSSFNRGLSSADETTMLRAFGTPGARTDQCSAVTAPIRNRIASRVDVGPLVVSGLDIAVASLKQVF